MYGGGMGGGMYGGKYGLGPTAYGSYPMVGGSYGAGGLYGNSMGYASFPSTYGGSGYGYKSKSRYGRW